MAICNIIRIITAGDTTYVEHSRTSASALNLLDSYSTSKHLADWFDTAPLLSDVDSEWIEITTTG